MSNGSAKHTFYIPKNASVEGAYLNISNELVFDLEPFNSTVHFLAGEGDVNGDGIDDMVGRKTVPVSYDQYLCVFLGSASGFSTVPSYEVMLDDNYSYGSPDSVYDGEFDFSIEGDLNGDGCSDLIWSYPLLDIGSARMVGVVYIFLGDPVRISSTPDAVIYGTFAGDASSLRGFRFGSILEYVGDVDGDSFDDMAAGYRLNLDLGYFFLIRGGPDVGSLDISSVRSWPTDDYYVEWFGGVGDVNGDTYSDVAMSYGSSMRVLFGGPTGLDGRNTTNITNAPINSRPIPGHFNSDAWPDIITTRYNSDSLREYQVSICHGPFNPGTRSDPDVLYNYDVSRFVGFGRAVVDVDGDGTDEVFLSIERTPDRSMDSCKDLGLFDVGPGGLSSEPILVLFSEDYPNGTWFDYVSIAGDPDKDGFPDLLVKGAGMSQSKALTYLVRQGFPSVIGLTINDLEVWQLPGKLNRTTYIDLSGDLRSIIRATESLPNGTVELVFDLGKGSSQGTIRVEWNITFFSVEPPFLVALEPLACGNAVEVSWTANGDDATLYNLYCNASGDWVSLTELPAKSGSFVHQDLTDGRVYHYRFRASNPDLGIESDLGMTYSAMPSDVLAPRIPPKVKVLPEPQGNTLRVQWTGVGDDCAGYQVMLELDSNIFVTQVDGPLETEAVITGLEDGVTYAVSVRARDEVPNWSPWSVPMNGTPNDRMPPPVPEGLVAASLNAGNAVQLEWLPSGDDTEGYQVYIQESTVWYPGPAVNGTSALVQDLTNGIEYDFVVVSHDEVPNFSSYSVVTSATPRDIVPPGDPANLTVVPGPGEGEISLAWMANTDDTAMYEVERMSPEDDWTTLHRSPFPGYVDRNVTNNITYSYRVRAIDDDGLPSNFSEVLSTIPMDTTPPEPPTLYDLPQSINTTFLVISGEAEPNSYLEILVDSEVAKGIWLGSSGTFEHTQVFVADGTYIIEARATDPQGNPSLVTSPWWVTVDTTPPVLVRVEPDLSKPVPKATTVILYFSEPVTGLEVRVGNGVFEDVMDHSDVENATVFSIDLRTVPRSPNLVLRISGSDVHGNKFTEELPFRLSSEKGGTTSMAPYVIAAVLVVALVAVVVWWKRRTQLP